MLRFVCLTPPAAAALFAQEPVERSLPWKPVTLDARNMPVATLLKSLREQTASVLDESVRPAPFLAETGWRDLLAGGRFHRSGAQGETGASPRDGTLEPGPPVAGDRRPPSYDGNFRVRLVRVASSGGLDSDRAQCVCSLELVWVPSVRPLFVEGKFGKLRVLDARGKPVEVGDEGSGLTAIDGRFSHSADLTLPGFPRADAAIRLVEGQFTVVAPSRFLDFRFAENLAGLREAEPGGAVRKLNEADVTCRIDRVVLGRDRWTVTMALEYPGGARPLESFQAGSLVVQNEFRLASADGKKSLLPTSYVIDTVSSRRAVVSYHFMAGHASRAAAGLACELPAPERLIDVPVRFAFKNVPLP